MPYISIVIPTYNREKLLPKAIDSVLKQQFTDWELLIIDDGSIDNTKNIVSKYNDSRIKYFYQKNGGVASAMNKGFSLASGKYFAWLDSDNYYESGIFQKIFEITSERSDLDIIYGNIEFVDETKILYKFRPPNTLSIKKALSKTSGAIPVQPAVFFKNYIFKDVGGFNTKYKIAGDIDFWLKVLGKIPSPTFLYIDKTFGYYLIDNKGISQGSKGIINGLKEMLDIGRHHNQTIHDKFRLIIKYAKGYIGNIFRSIIKNL